MLFYIVVIEICWEFAEIEFAKKNLSLFSFVGISLLSTLHTLYKAFCGSQNPAFLISIFSAEDVERSIWYWKQVGLTPNDIPNRWYWYPTHTGDIKPMMGKPPDQVMTSEDGMNESHKKAYKTKLEVPGFEGDFAKYRSETHMT